MDLGGLALRHVDLQMGVGNLDMDLRGPVSHDYDVRIQGGVGNATVHLPADASVDAEASGGLGSIHASGLRKEGSHYYNESYGKAKNTVRITVEGGIGNIRLIEE
jgi:predicted membrane protein